VVLIVVAAAIVVGVIIVALGRGGELAKSTADFVPFGPGDITATDVALLRPPPSLYGYHIPATDQALSRIAQTITERDVEIATLRRQLAELRSIAEADTGLRVSTDSGVPGAPGVPDAPGVRPSVWRRELTDPQPAHDPQRAQDPWPPQAPWSAWERQSGLAPRSAAEPDDPSQQAARDPAPDPFEDTDPGTSGMAW
jgi:hypothetical protein